MSERMTDEEVVVALHDWDDDDQNAICAEVVRARAAEAAAVKRAEEADALLEKHAQESARELARLRAQLEQVRSCIEGAVDEAIAAVFENSRRAQSKGSAPYTYAFMEATLRADVSEAIRAALSPASGTATERCEACAFPSPLGQHTCTPTTEPGKDGESSSRRGVCRPASCTPLAHDRARTSGRVPPACRGGTPARDPGEAAR